MNSKFLILFSILFLFSNVHAQERTIYHNLKNPDGHGGEIYSVSFSPDGSMIASGSDDNTIKLWRVSDGSLIRTLERHKSYVYSVSFSPDGSMIASGSDDNTIKLWRVSDGSLIRTLKGHEDNVWSVSFSPDGSMIASGSWDETIKLWRVSDGSLIRTLKGHKNWVRSVSFSPDGSMIASGSDDNTIKLWRVSDGSLIRTLEGHWEIFNSVSFSPDGSMIASGSDDNTIKLWRVSDGSLIITLEGHKNWVESVSFSPDGSMIASGSEDNTIKLWRVSDGSLIRTLEGHKGYVWSVSFSPDGNYLASGSKDGTIKIWKVNESYAKKVVIPPKLSLDISFKDTDGNNFLDAEENGKIIVKVKNNGEGDTENLILKIEGQTYTRDLVYTPTLNCGVIKSKTERVFEIDIKALRSVKNSSVTFIVKGEEQNGFDPEPVKLIFSTRELLLPKFEIVDYGIESNRGDNIIRAGEISDIKIRIQNKGEGKGKNVRINIQLPQNVFFEQTSKQNFDFIEILQGDFVDLDFSIIPNKKVEREIELKFNVVDDNTNVLLPLRLSIDKPLQTIQELVVKGKENKVEIKEVAGLRSDVEIDIPETGNKKRNAVALLIGISNYQNSRIPAVKYANRDVSLMRQYLEKTLGYDASNILPQRDDEIFTLAKMRTYLKNILPSYLRQDGTSEVFIYFVGHGAPSPNGDATYFIPYDGDPDYVSDINAYNSREFYEDIRNLKASKKIVVIDACFSGQAGDGSMLISNASPIYVRVENPLMVDNKSILFLSSEGDQVSNWYPEKRQSMFTYFFLKGLKGEADVDGDGKITVGELKRFINDENEGLPYYSNRLFQRKQRAVIVGDEKIPIVVR